MQFAHERHKLVREPSSAVAVVRFLGKPQFIGKLASGLRNAHRGNGKWMRPSPGLERIETIQ